jgi:hypothetical protein
MVNPSYLQVVPFSNGAWGDQHDTYFGNSATRAEPETGITYITWKGDNPEHDIDSYEKFVVGSVNTTESPLPSKINGFKAEYYRNKIVIQWRAHHCENLKAFLIEKSRDGKNFKSIISINAKPNQLTETYQEYDPHPHKEWNYYRLCIIDKKGQLQYSDIKKVWIQPNNNTGQIISRIRKNYLHISLINTSAMNILTISNLSGQVLYKQNIAMKSISVDISPFVPGLYFLRIIGLSGVHTETFLKE